jgi:hypothetical protein
MQPSNPHSQFGRATMIAAAAIIERHLNNAQFDRYVLELGLEGTDATQGTLPHKVNGLIRHAIANPETTAPDGMNIWDVLVFTAADSEKPSPYSGQLSDRPEVVKFVRALARDGYSLEVGGLRRTLPADIDLPAADDEVHALLDELGLTVPRGHLDQAITNHTDGNWAAANGQLRTFFEALLDEAARRLDFAAFANAETSHARRTLLANLNPPFLSRQGNEWEDNGKGYVNALFYRLHPAGSHPGLSDEEDSTFRLHTLLIVARLLLRRLKARL